MKEKFGIIAGDFHCGHRVGITPPSWQYQIQKRDVSKTNKYAQVQQQCWAFFINQLNSINRKIDILISTGDLIDGRGEKSGGTELISTDREIQCNMAEYVIDRIKADKIIMVYGTAYHVGQLEDWENKIARSVKAMNIGSHEWLDINGKVWDIKHSLGGSGVPHSNSQLKKDYVWNALWSARNEQPRSSVFVRGHLHSYQMIDEADWTGIVAPALQAMGSKFGSRICSKTVDFGFLSFLVKEDGEIEWHKHIARIEAQRARSIKL